MPTLTRRDLTTGEVAGSGFFDELQRTSKAHLQEEFDAGRIVGTDYSSAYLGMTQSNLQSAIQYLLQYEVTNQQILVLQEQIEQAKKQNALLELQKEQLTIANATATFNLESMLPAQLEAQLEQNKTLVQNTLNTITQGELLAKQVLQAQSQIDLTAKQEDLVDEQIKTEKANTTLPTAGLTKAQYDKSLSEVALMQQKLLTEKAQTEGTTTSLGGLVGAELDLKKNQGNSFLRDAEQKAAKAFSDTFAILYSTDKDAFEDYALWGLDKDNSRLVMDKLVAGAINP